MTELFLLHSPGTINCTPNTPGDLVTPPNTCLTANTQAILFAYLDGGIIHSPNCALCL